MTMTKKDRRIHMLANLEKAFRNQYRFSLVDTSLQPLHTQLTKDYMSSIANLPFKDLTDLHATVTGHTNRYLYLGELLLTCDFQEGSYGVTLSRNSTYSDVHLFRGSENPLIITPTFKRARAEFFKMTFDSFYTFYSKFRFYADLLTQAGYDVKVVEGPLDALAKLNARSSV